MKRKDFLFKLALGGIGFLIGCTPLNSKPNRLLETKREILKLNEELKHIQDDDLFRKKCLELLKLKEGF